MEAFDQLIRGCAPSLLRLAVMLTGNREDAEDLLQATLLQAHRHRRRRLLDMDAPTAYLRKTMVNAHISSRRTESRRARRIGLDVVHDVAIPSEDSTLDLRDEVWTLLTTLPPKQRAVLALRYYEDLPDAEIADVLGVSAVTVRTNALRALTTLRERLATTPEVTP